MKNLFHSSISNNSKYCSSLVELGVPSNNQRRAPRHISSPETNSHRGQSAFVRIDYTPKVCRIKPAPELNVAVDILRYQLSDRATKQKHLENVRCNLRHRLEVAKAKGNKQLVSMIQAEYGELEPSI